MNTRTFVLIFCLVAASLFTLGAFDRRDERWSRIQSACLASAGYCAVIAVWIGWGA